MPTNRTRILIDLVIAGVLFVAFFDIGDFSMKQSLVLTLLSIALYWAIEGTSHKSNLKFNPYWLSVSPNWVKILTDYKLIKSPEEWYAIENSFQSKPFDDYDVLRHGIVLTILQQSQLYDQFLVYSDYHHSFKSRIDYVEDMKGVRIQHDKDRLFLGKESSVRFFVKFGGDGLNIGLCVPDWWWAKVKDSCPKPIRTENDHPTGQVLLFLGILSFRDFDLYWWPPEYDAKFYEKTVPAITKLRDEFRDKFKWKEIPHPDVPELAIDWPDSIENEYIKVEHREI
jgi:hypothetical protein